jgi:hypothetical protein
LSDPHHPDFATWLACAEAEEDIADYPQPPAAPARPDRGWQRFGDVACNIVSGLIGGGAMLLAVGAAVFALRLL